MIEIVSAYVFTCVGVCIASGYEREETTEERHIDWNHTSRPKVCLRDCDNYYCFVFVLSTFYGRYSPYFLYLFIWNGYAYALILSHIYAPRIDKKFGMKHLKVIQIHLRLLSLPFVYARINVWKFIVVEVAKKLTLLCASIAAFSLSRNLQIHSDW